MPANKYNILFEKIRYSKFLYKRVPALVPTLRVGMHLGRSASLEHSNALKIRRSIYFDHTKEYGRVET